MKDYYYFLGISADASAEDIKKAYRKLSLKYHPDKNDADVFFEHRFREVQEAYETLINEESKRNYDRIYTQNVKNNLYSLPPVITNFNVNKIRVMKGDEIIITWQTNNADVVKILPFGLVSAYGEKRIKITEFKEGKFHIVLQAMNTMINKSVVKGVSVTEVLSHEEPASRGRIHPIGNTPPPSVNKGTMLRAKVMIMSLVLFAILLAIHFIAKYLLS